MGASFSKSNKSKSSFRSFYSVACKKTTNISSFIRVEPATANKLQKDNQKHRNDSEKKSKKAVTRSIISKPSDFVHLNHAGNDYKSLDTLHVPTEQAQIIHIITANTNYATDHSYRSTKQRIELERKQLKRIKNQKRSDSLLKKFGFEGSLQVSSENILPKEDFHFTISDEAKVGIAY